jgi:capsular exopolysaccharide synthesis family protein
MQKTDILPLDIYDFFGIFRRRFMSFIIMAVLILTPALLYINVTDPKYTATALIQVDPDRNILQEVQDEFRNNASMSALVDGEAEVIRSDRVLIQLIRDAGLLSDPEFGVKHSRMDRLKNMIGLEMSALPTGEVALNQIMNRLRNATDVRRRGGTYLVEISVTTKTPEKSADLANKIVDIHTRLQVDEKIRRLTFARDVIAGRLEESREALEDSETRLSEFFLNAVDITISQTGRADLFDLKAGIETAQNRITEIDRRQALVSQLLAPDRAMVSYADLSDEALRNLMRQREVLRDEITQNPVNKDVLESRIASLDTQISRRASTTLSALRQEASDAKTELGRFEGDLRSSLLAGDVPPRVLSGMFELQQEGEIARANYMSMLSRMRQLESMADLQVPDLRVVSEAVPSFTKSSPRSRLILLVGFAFSLLGGMGFALLREFQIGGFTSIEHVSNTLRIEDVLSVPYFSKPGKDTVHLIKTDPLGAYAESIRRLRYLSQKLIDKIISEKQDFMRTGAARNKRDGKFISAAEQDIQRGKIICVTSTTQDEGKTTLAISLARSFADAGLKTVIVDLDLRNPSVADILGSPKNDNLILSLKGEISDVGIVPKYDGSALDIIPGGQRARIPTDQIFTSESFVRFVENLKDSYDLVIFDCPPVMPVIDPLLVIRHADIVMMPIRFGQTTQSGVKAALKRISSEIQPNTRVIPVLNMETTTAHNYYTEYYS